MPDDETKQRVAAAYRERDAALLALAREKERSNALKLHLERLGEPEPPLYPANAGVGPTPLRYLVVDRVNDGLKRALGPVHSLIKKALK